jgi:H+/Cl- antiporter ClcA
MWKFSRKNFSKTNYYFFITSYLLKWIMIGLFIGALSGSASALFLYSLDFVTIWREDHVWIIYFLPLGGLIIGLLYHYWGTEVEAGNNLLLDEIHNPKKVIHFKMAPMVLIGTLGTHLFGGSAGKEGTAVQMGGSIADQLTHLFKFQPRDRMVVLICGISGGFASVFGTPLAGAIFGLEVYLMGKLRYNAILPSIITAIIADQVCTLWGIHHTSYSIGPIPNSSIYSIVYCLLAGVAFGLIARFFTWLTHRIGKFFKSKISYAPFRPLLGGIVVALGVILLGTTKYIGLGIPTIEASFLGYLPPYDFLLKIIFTAITLGAAFKGGEVTPLFFIGATLGNALAYFIPLPVGMLAGLGFVAVFAGAANTPIATTFMAIELFGIEMGIYAAIASVVSYLFSGHLSIYGSQVIGERKHLLLGKEEGKKISDLNQEK